MICEASSKTDSRSVLWGEIQVNCNASDAINFWKPIEEYQNITVKHERNIDEQIHCSNNSALASEDEKKIYYDPVGSHIIELRRYLLLDQHLHAKQEASERAKRRKSKKDFSIPEFPKQYPFSQSLEATQDKCKMLVKYKGGISKCQVKEKRMLFIERVLEQTGFCVKDTARENIPLEYLSDLLDDFLQKFVELLSHNKSSDPFSEDEDLWGPLETTLRNFGIGGISTLHAFYYENVAKKHDILFKKCMDLYDQFQNFGQINDSNRDIVHNL